MIRLIDIILSILGILLLLPLILCIALMIVVESRGGVFFIQERVGHFGKMFKIVKFRTMFVLKKSNSLLTIGSNDSRLTKVGRILRRYKLDEIPQLFNVFCGSMSIVGPRPEVRFYVDMYPEEYKNIFNVLPGITDISSILFINESDLLANSNNPEKLYIEEIMIKKLKLNLIYIKKRTVSSYFLIIYFTLRKIFYSKHSQIFISYFNIDLNEYSKYIS